MTKFKVGDRVAVYGAVWDLNEQEMIGGVNSRSVGAITEMEDGCVTIESPKKNLYRGNLKQCRLLRKKPRRRIWVSPEFHSLGEFQTSSQSLSFLNTYHSRITSEFEKPGYLCFEEVEPK